MSRLYRLLAAVLFTATAAYAVNPPVILSIDPKDTIAGTGQLDVAVTGANFISGATVRVNNLNRPTQFVDTQHVIVTILSSDVSSPTTLSLVVANPSGGGISSAVTFDVLPNSPAISSLTPSTVTAGGDAFTLKVTGTNFARTAQVKVNNVAHTTTFIDSKTLTIQITAAEINAPRTLNVFVANPNLKNSNTVTLPVTSTPGAPTITLLSPNPIAANSGAQVLQIIGTNFTNPSIVKFNTVQHSSTFVDSTHINVNLTTSDVATAGTKDVTVTTAAGTSSPATLTITSGALPTITSINPTSVVQGSGGLTLTIIGTNFTTGATVKVGTAAPRNATFIDSTHVTVPIFPAETSSPGQIAITVTTPGTTGGTSNTVTFFVSDLNAPTVSSLSPQSAAAGSPDTKVVVTGSGFQNTDSILVNGAKRTTEFISATQLAVTLAAAELASPGQFSIAVQNKLGDTSAPLFFQVSSASGPVITQLTPSIAAAGGGGFTLTITGTNFTDQSVVSVDNAVRNSQFLGPTQLTISIFASDVTTARQIPIRVTNPGGVSSDPVDLVVAVIPPAISSLSPSSVVAGDSGFTLTVSGTGFSPTSIINFGGVVHLTQFNSASGTLSTAILPNEIASSGVINVIVTDRGVDSAPFLLQVQRPQIFSLSPSGATAGGPSIDLTITGSGFLSTSKILFRGLEKETFFNAETGALTTVLSAADIAEPGIYAVSVRNTPNAASLASLFTVTSPGDPRIDALDPPTIIAGTTLQQLRVLGANFTPSSVVNVNGSPRDTTFVSSSELQIFLSAADMATPGTLAVIVVNADGKTSPAATLTIVVGGPPPPRRRGVGH